MFFAVTHAEVILSKLYSTLEAEERLWEALDVTISA
jgi:hypothetical protein